MRLLPAALVILGVSAFANSFSGPFLFDDSGAILDNSHIRRLWPLGETMIGPPQSTLAGRPIIGLSLAVNYAISGQHVWSYHALNLAIHLLAGLLLFGIVRRTLASERFGSSIRRHAAPLATAAAAIWLVHPLQTESVTYVIQRAEGLMGLFYLLTLYAVIRSAESKQAWAWQAAAVAACLVGMGCKEVMVTAPVVVLLYDVFFISGSPRETLRRRGVLYAALAATWLLLIALVAPGPRSESAGFSLTRLKWWQYACTQPGVLLHYLRLTIWPHPLCLDYYWPIAKSAGQIVPAAIVIGLLAIATLWALRKRRPVGFAGAWFFVILAPSSSIVPILDPAFEHRMYLSLAAACVLFVVAGWTLVDRIGIRLDRQEQQRGLFFTSTLLVVVLLLTILTVRRNAMYHTAASIWGDVVRQRPDNPRGHNNLGASLYHGGDVGGAERHIRQAIALLPDYYEAHYDLGILLGEHGRLEEAITEFRRVQALNRRDPRFPYNLAIAYRLQGKMYEAIKLFERALILRPDYAKAHNALGLTLATLGRESEALGHFQTAIRIEPDWPEPLNAAAWILATAPEAGVREPARAVELAERACKLTEYKDAGGFDTLAAAYAAAGDFERAKFTAARGLDLALRDPHSTLASDMRARLKLYGEKKPFVEPRRGKGPPGSTYRAGDGAPS